MITPDTWVADAVAGLRAAFPDRLRYVGLQGSYRRGEASDASDIDLVVILDTVSLDDLDIYRSIVRSLPEGEKACGFICGEREFHAWPRHELFPFRMDTRDYYGSLDDFMPPIDRRDIEENVRIGLSGLYHVLTHSYLYADESSLPEIVRGAYKSAAFVLVVKSYLETDTDSPTKTDLYTRLTGVEREILSIGQNWETWLGEHSAREAVLLLRSWCERVLVEMER